MSGRRWLVLGWFLLTLSAGVGCVSSSHTAYNRALQPIEKVPVIAPARNHVYLFMLNGSDVLEINHLTELKEQVIGAGFAKVYYAQRFDRRWFYEELHRLHRDDPDNRFVLLGYGTAAPQLQELAECVSRDGIPLDAVLFLDPVGGKGDLTQCSAYPSRVIRSNRWLGSPRLTPTESVSIGRAGHLAMPAHPTTLASVLEVLTDSALRVPYVIPEIDCYPQVDGPKPIPRPTEPKENKGYPPEWGFLCPNPRQ